MIAALQIIKLLVESYPFFLVQVLTQGIVETMIFSWVYGAASFLFELKAAYGVINFAIVQLPILTLNVRKQ